MRPPLTGGETPSSRAGSGSRLLAFGLSAALALLSPGLAPYQAFAAQSGPKGPDGRPGVPGLPQLPTSALPTVPAASIPATGVDAPVAAVPGPVAIPATDAVKGTAPGTAAPAAPGVRPMLASPAAPERGVEPVAAQESLAAGVAELGAARSDGERQGALGRLFTGLKRRLSDSAEAPAVPLSAAASDETLSKASTPDLEALASDASKPHDERLSAVKALAKQTGAEPQAALERVGTGGTVGDAKDYEVRRASLKALAEQGKVVSLPAMSRAHAAEVLKKLADDKPEAAAFDYDGTLEEMNSAARPETGAALKAAADAGVEVMILTDRPDAGDRPGSSILEVLSGFAPEQKAALSIGANRGARVLLLDGKGEARLFREEPGWTPEQKASIEAAAAAVTARWGDQEYKGKTAEFKTYGWVKFLPLGLPASEVEAAAKLMEGELSARGLKLEVTGRTAFKPEDPPYLTLSKVDKSLGALLLRRNRELFGRLRDAYRLLPERLHKTARKVLERLANPVVPVAKTLFVGDYFFGARNVDKDMVKGAPGALTLAVGGSADPRLENTFVWPSKGPEASAEILAALAKRPAGVDRKALTGLFAQRTVSIVAFVLTALAYPFVAIPAVGASGYGALMALGTLAAIATGPLNGLIAQKLSSRGAMVFNTVVRAVLALALPVFTMLGVLNFGTLLVASIANGWLLSSIMTTENIYIRRMAGAHLGTVNALAWMNYLAIQVVLGLILGIGSVIDKMNLMIPFYVSAAAHFFVILPIIYLTIPRISAPQAAKAAEAAQGPSPLRRAADKVSAFVKRFWKEIGIFAAGVALFPLIHSTIPATLALLYWVKNTAGFKLIWANKPLRNALLFSTLLAFLLYPLQNFSLPLMAKTLVGDAGKSQLLGQLLGALFFGQLIANTSQAKLPKLKLPLLGRFGAQRIVQGLVLGLVGAWVYTGLFPGSALGTLAALGLGAGLMGLSSRLTNRGWIRFLSLGLPFILLPLLSWGSVPLLFASILVIGLFQGPANVSLGTYIMGKIPKAQMETITGVQGSLFNAAISLGYGVVSLLPLALTPMFPAGLWVLGAAYILAGLAFFVAPRFLPGLAKSSLEPKKEKE